MADKPRSMRPGRPPPIPVKAMPPAKPEVKTVPVSTRKLTFGEVFYEALLKEAARLLRMQESYHDVTVPMKEVGDEVEEKLRAEFPSIAPGKSYRVEIRLDAGQKRHVLIERLEATIFHITVPKR